MVFDVLILIIASVSNLILGSLVFLRNPRRAESRAFFAISLSVSAWTVTNYFTDHAPTLALNQFFAYLAFGFGFTVLASIMLFAYYFGGRRIASHRRKIFDAAFVLLGSAFAFSSLVTGPVSKRPDGGTDVALGPLYTLYPILVLVMFGMACRYLWKTYRTAGSDLRLRAQTRLIMFGIAGFIVLAMLTNIVIPALLNDWSIARIGPLLTVFLVGSVFYAIVKHRLFDIRMVVARSVAYLLLLTTLAALYGASIVAIGTYFFPNERINSTEASVFVALALILAFTFQPLRRFFEKVTDHIFFRGRYDSESFLNNVSNILATELVLDQLLQDSLREICKGMRITSAQLVMIEGGKTYKEAHYGPHHPTAEAMVDKLHARVLVSDDLDPSPLKAMLDEHHVRVSLMLWTQGELVGFLFLGDKQTGEIYSGQDLRVLEILRKELAVAVNNAKAYEKIAHFNVTLQHRVREATQRLRTANQKLKVLDKAKDDFISMASHQLGTPLTAVTGYLSMTLDEDKGNMTKPQREYVGFALESAEKLVAMASDLLNVSRLSSGRFMIQRQSVDLVSMVRQEIEQLRPQAERKDLKLTYTTPSASLTTTLDESKTRQVIMNFIDNAIYYTATGSVQVALAQEGNEAVFTVTDTGIGVPVKEREKLFSKFYRAENAKKARPDGTGLGLYLAKQVIEEQDGKIIFTSELGKGSTFGFRLPLEAPKPGASEPAQTDESDKSAKAAKTPAPK